jgi:hypothetical protein
MFDHSHPAVVGGLLVRELARRIGGELVDVAEFHFLVLALFGVEGGTHECRWRTPARRHRQLRVARKLKIRIGRQRRGAAIGHVEGHIDDVAAAMERQHLYDLGAIRRGGSQLQFDAIRAGSKFARTRKHLVQRAVIG